MTKLAAKLADRPPAYCCACYGASAEWRYVDFLAAYDGPVIPGAPNNQPVDDLVICENCLSEAFALLDPEGLHDHIRRLEDTIGSLKDDITAKDRMIHGYQQTTEELVHHPPSPMPGKRSWHGVPEDVEKQMRLAKRLREGQATEKEQRRAERAKKRARKVEKV